MNRTRQSSKRWIAAGAFALVCLHASAATAADTAACTTAAEDGQRARAAGKLLEAQKHFAICSGRVRCPAIVQQDCAKWAAEVVDATPSIVVDARDADGNDVDDVKVIVDGDVVATQLDGKAIPIDPGPHTILLRRQGSPDVVERIIAKEGAKARPLRVAFSRPSLAAGQPTAADDSKRPSPEHASVTTDERTRGHTTYPWLVFGAGVVAAAAGIVVMLAAPAMPPGCDATSEVCSYLTPHVSDQRSAGERSPTPDERTELDARRETARQSIGQPKLGLTIAIAGVVVMAGGFIWHMLEPVGAKKTEAKQGRARVQAAPWVSPGGGGLAAGGAF